MTSSSTAVASFGYHEVTDNPAAAGFQRPGALPYKHRRDAFARDLEAIAAGPCPPERVTELDLTRPGRHVLLTFDDGGKSAVSIADMLAARGWKGHFFIVTSLVGTRTFLTAGEIRYLRQCGHEVGSHSNTHPDIFREVAFDRIGVFDEDLVRNQDDELNARLLKQGGRIMLIPEVVSHYYARGSLGQVARMFYQYGYFKPLAAWKVGQIMTLRQVVPALFVGALAVTGALALVLSPARLAVAGLAGAYLAAALASAALAVRRHGARCAAALLLVFPTLHCSYGLGSITAVLERAIGRRRLPHHVASVPLSR